jgi:hypothetical protein
MTTTTPSVQDRAEALILDAYSQDWEPHPSDVAMALIDEDVASGDLAHEDIDLAASEYIAIAARLLGQEV